MSVDVSTTREKVEQYLSRNFAQVSVNEAGVYSLRKGSARIFVEVRVAGSAGEAKITLVNLDVLLLQGVRETPAVFEYVALHADDYQFGHLNAARTDDGLRLFLSHTLLGDYLDEDELRYAVGGMATVADDLDDELQLRFGGARFHEQSATGPEDLAPEDLAPEDLALKT